MSGTKEKIRKTPIQSARKIARNFASVTAANLISRALGLLAVIYLPRVLGPKGFGQVSWAQSVFTIGLYFGDMGLRTLGIRTISQRREEKDTIVSNYFSLKVLLSLGTALMIIPFAIFFSKSDTTRWLTVLYGLSLLATGFLLEWAFTGLERMEFVGFARILQYMTYVGLLILVVKNQGDVLFVPVTFFVGTIASAGFLWTVYHRKFPTFQFKIQRNRWLEIISKAFPIGSAYLLAQVYIALPILLLGWIKNDQDVGYYSAAFRSVAIFRQLIWLFLWSLSPVAAYRWKHAPKTVKSLLERVLKLIVVFSIPISMGALVVGKPLLTLIFGVDFLNSVIPFKIILWNLLLTGISGVFNELILIMNGKQGQFFTVIAIGAIASLPLNVGLISAYGHLGSAYAWIITEFIVVFVSYFFAKRYVHLRIWSDVVKTFIAAIGMALIVWLLFYTSGSIWISIPVGAIVYGIALVIVRVINMDDLNFITSFIPLLQFKG